MKDEAGKPSRLSVSVVTDAPIPRLFDFLTRPANHVRLDGSGTLLSASDQPITAVGDRFAVTVSTEHGRSEIIENHVVSFLPDVELAWLPAAEGAEPRGVRWSWEFDVGPRGETVITQTCDWSQVTDGDYLAGHPMPEITSEEMRLSVKRLIDLVSSYA